MIIFKICQNAEWAQAEAMGPYRGTAKDQADGFIHFSTTAQLAGTLTRHFADANDLVLVAVDADALGDNLKWEIAGDEDLFPHLYAPLELAAVRWATPIPRKANGTFILPVQAFVQPTNDTTRIN